MRLPRDRILLVESNNNQITERTLSGAIQTSHMIYQQPLNIQKAADDGMLVVCRNRIVEFDKDWNQRAGVEYQRNTFDIISGLKLPNGDVLCVINAYQGANCIRLDSKLKETNKTYTFGRVQNPHVMEVVGDEKILVCELDRVAEYDLKTGKQTWKHECAAPTSCQRLKNGNTLISVLNNASQQLIEVDPTGEVVWDYSAKDGLRVGRAIRR
jgi:outer membrane protein assembly factor BamB